MSDEENQRGRIIFDVRNIGPNGLNVDFSHPGSFYQFDDSALFLTGDVVVKGQLKVVDTEVRLEATVKTALHVGCARCLKIFDKPVELSVLTGFFVRKEEEEEREEFQAEDKDYAPYDGEKVDLFSTIRDHIALSVPFRPLCSESCKGLCPQCGQDLNEKSCDCPTEEVDPRLKVLEKLKFDK